MSYFSAGARLLFRGGGGGGGGRDIAKRSPGVHHIREPHCVPECVHVCMKEWEDTKSVLYQIVWCLDVEVYVLWYGKYSISITGKSVRIHEREEREREREWDKEIVLLRLQPFSVRTSFLLLTRPKEQRDEHIVWQIRQPLYVHAYLLTCHTCLSLPGSKYLKWIKKAKLWTLFVGKTTRPNKVGQKKTESLGVKKMLKAYDLQYFAWIHVQLLSRLCITRAVKSTKRNGWVRPNRETGKSVRYFNKWIEARW